MLLTTFSKALANSLRVKMMSLVGTEPSIAARIVVKAISAVGYDLYSERFGHTSCRPEDHGHARASEWAGVDLPHNISAHEQAKNWRYVAFCSLALSASFVPPSTCLSPAQGMSLPTSPLTA